MNAQNDTESTKPNLKPDVDLQHNFNYVGGAFAYKNSRKKRNVLDPQKKEKSVLITGYGRARPVDVAKKEHDPRAGNFPEHNSPKEFREDIEILEAKSLESYKALKNIAAYEEKGYKHKQITLTKDKIKNISMQFSHLSIYAFNQMLCITTPDKRDFDIWYKKLTKAKQTIVAYPHPKTGLTRFVQVIQHDQDGEVSGIKHCIFDNGAPIVVNESVVDVFGNLRQIAHVGVKGGSLAKNAVERFDDGTVIWTVTMENQSGTAALRPNGEVLIVQDELNDASMLAARNLGAEGLNPDGTWTGKFDLQACLVEENQLRLDYKVSVRKQISKIIDGASIPGLLPVFNA